jgi:hypothetical protein
MFSLSDYAPIVTVGLLEVIRIRKSGYPVRTADAEFVARYRILETDPNKWPSSRDICTDHGTPGEWQIGTTMVFMRDAMFSLLETKRAKVLDQRIRGLQSWMKEELVRRTWTRRRSGVERMQAQVRGTSARKRIVRVRQEVTVERDCENGIKQRKLELLEAAITGAEAISHTFPMLAEAKAIVDRLRDERQVEDMLNYAITARDADELKRALQAADALKIESLWARLEAVDPRHSLISRSRTLIDQLVRYDELMVGLATAMRERTVEALKTMILECESVELECGELTEARAMLKMAEFEQNSRVLRQNKRQAQIQKMWAKQEVSEKQQPNAAMLQEVAAIERRIREFQHALVAAQENGEAFPGEIQRIEMKISECQQKLQGEAMKEEERRQQIELEKAELEEAKRTAARVAEVSILVAAIIPSIRAALSTYREKNLENVVTKIRARLGSEANKSAELALAASVLEEMKLRSRATEGEVLAMIKAAVETGVSIHKPLPAKVKALLVAVSAAAANDVYNAAVSEARQTADLVLDAWTITRMLTHAARIGKRTGLACALKRAHDNAGFQKFAGREGRDAMATALKTVTEDGGFEVAAWPTPSTKQELTVRTQGGQIMIHFLDGQSQAFPQRTRLSEVIDQICAKRGLSRPDHYGIYQTTRAGTGERLLSLSADSEVTLGDVCQEWVKQAIHFADIMGTKSQGDASAMGDAKFKYRLFFLRKLIFGDSLSNGSDTDLDALYWYARKRVSNGTFRCSEDDTLTLASLRLQVEMGDHSPDTPTKLKSVLPDYIPNNLKNSQSAKEWHEDICTNHERMQGFSCEACKKNYVRLLMGQHLWGFTCFTLRQSVDPSKPHVSDKVKVGINYRGVSLFNSHDEPYLSYTYLECEDVEVELTRVHIALNNGENLWFQASIAAAQEIATLIQCYRAGIPRKKSNLSQLRTVQLEDEAPDSADNFDKPPQAEALSVVSSEATIASPAKASAPKHLFDEPAEGALPSAPTRDVGGLFDD